MILQNKRNIVKEMLNIKKIIAVISLLLIPSTMGILFFTTSIFFVLTILGDTGDFSVLYSKENVESNYIFVLFTLVITGPIGFGLGVKLWEMLMKKTSFVSQDFIDYWYGRNQK